MIKCWMRSKLSGWMDYDLLKKMEGFTKGKVPFLDRLGGPWSKKKKANFNCSQMKGKWCPFLATNRSMSGT